MPDPAQSGAAAATKSDADGNALHDLRHLLVGQELEQLAALRDRMADPEKRAADLAEALPAAIRSAKAKPLRDAMEPVFEKAFSNSVRKKPKELADAIYPIIGPAIRASIAAALRDFAETLNQIAEKSVSLRSIKWRIESVMGGKPFAEILLARSFLYSVEQVFLIHRASGLLLQHAAAKNSVLKDADMISGMLTAIQDFLSDSFAEGGQDLQTVDTGRFKLWITYSPQVLLVAAVNGTAPTELRQAFRKALDQIDVQLQSQIDNFKQDDLSVFEPAKPLLEACLLGQSSPVTEKKKVWWPWLAAFGTVALALAAFWTVNQMRWNRYFEALRQQPGIVVTDIQRNGMSWVVSGLRDPLAADPAGMLAERKLDPAKVHFALQPFLSLNTPFATKRAVADAVALIERQVVRFDSGSARLAISEAGRIEEAAYGIAQLLQAAPGARILLQGHADETGTSAANDKLAGERANQVADTLAAQGIARTALSVAGGSGAAPLRRGATEWDRAANRSVSLAVVLQ